MSEAEYRFGRATSASRHLPPLDLRAHTALSDDASGPRSGRSQATSTPTSACGDDELIAELCSRVADLRGDVARLVDDEVRRLAPLASDDEQQRLAGEALARLRGLGDLEVLLADPHIDEILVNAASDVWIDRSGRLEPVGTLQGQPVEHLIERILAPIGRRIDRSSPIVDARLGDGSRVCAVAPPVAVDGTSLSIRRFPLVVRPLADFVDDAGELLLSEIVEAKCNVVVTGATSSGKTSLLASLIGVLPDSERIVVLEDTSELPIAASSHSVRLEARPPTPDLPAPIPLEALVRAALRLRPDRLVVGEIRGDEVLGLVQAMNTGHDGSFSTCHANGPLDALFRLESLTLRAAPTWPLPAIREQLMRSIDVIVHVERDGQRRRVGAIDEVGLERSDASIAPTMRPLGIRTDGAFEIVGELTRRRR